VRENGNASSLYVAVLTWELKFEAVTEPVETSNFNGAPLFSLGFRNLMITVVVSHRLSLIVKMNYHS